MIKWVFFIGYYITKFHEGLINVSLNNKEGFVDNIGREVVPPKYDYVGSFSDGLVRVRLDKLSFYMDKTGREYREI